MKRFLCLLALCALLSPCSSFADGWHDGRPIFDGQDEIDTATNTLATETRPYLFWAITNNMPHNMTNAFLSVTNWTCVSSNGMYAGNSNITVVTAGRYEISFQISFYHDVSTDYDFTVNLCTNGAVCNYIGFTESVDEKDASPSAMGVLDLKANDSLSIRMYVVGQLAVTVTRAQVVVKKRL